MTIQESVNRGFNLLSVSLVSLAGLAFLPEAFLENDIPDKVDDTLLFVLGMIAIWWYNRSGNRYMRSVLPVAFVVLALVVKLGGIMVEIGDAEAVGDDFGGLILFISAVALVLYQYLKTAKLQSGN